MNDTHVCEAEGCTSVETTHYHNGFAEPELVEWLCNEHAVEEGYCLWCQNYAAGSEDYDFSEYRGGQEGYHASCWRDFIDDAGIEDDDEDDLYPDDDEYPSNWYDPDMDFENEESNGVYIGEGSETQGFFMDVDGSAVHVLGNPGMTDEQAETLANVVRATRKKLDEKGDKE